MDGMASQARNLKVRGGCHCGRVAFEVAIRPPLQVHLCNCSICTMSGFRHLIVPASAFELLSGEGDLTDYQFRTKTAHHLFCRHCGIKSFYVPRSNPDGYSVNVSCLDLPPEVEIEEIPIDGRNWSESAGKLRHLSEE